MCKLLYSFDKRSCQSASQQKGYCVLLCEICICEFCKRLYICELIHAGYSASVWRSYPQKDTGAIEGSHRHLGAGENVQRNFGSAERVHVQQSFNSAERGQRHAGGAESGQKHFASKCLVSLLGLK